MNVAQQAIVFFPLSYLQIERIIFFLYICFAFSSIKNKFSYIFLLPNSYNAVKQYYPG